MIMERQRIVKVWIEADGIYAQTDKGLTASYPFSMWTRLKNATERQRNDFYLSYSGIHWPQIDEDLSFEGMFAHAGYCERTEGENTVFWEPQA